MPASSHTRIRLVVFCTLIAFTTSCPALSPQHMAIQEDTSSTTGPCEIHVSMPPTARQNPIPRIARNIISTRSTNTTANTTKPRLIAKNLSVLLPSHQHAALLAKMFSQVRDILLSTIDTLSFPAHLTFTYGVLVLHLYFIREPAFHDAIWELLETLCLVFFPLSFIAITLTGVVLGWAMIEVGYF